MKLRAVVTLGGTREAVDDVRVLTNVSTGRFGAAIARALAARGVEVIAIASRDAALLLHGANVRVLPFESSADLDRQLDATREFGAIDLLFMAAAVSDYAPVASAGKISSDLDEIHIVLRRSPKILPTLGRRFPGTTVVGFKLLSNVSPHDLYQAAQRQMRTAGVHLVVANDAVLFGDTAHPAHLFTASGHREIAGAREATAEIVAENAIRVITAARGRSSDLEGWTEIPDALGLPDAQVDHLTGVTANEASAALAAAAADRTWPGGSGWVRVGNGGFLKAAVPPEAGVPIVDRGRIIGVATPHGADLVLSLPADPGALDRVAAGLSNRFDGICVPHAQAESLARRGFRVTDVGATHTRLTGPLHRPHAGPDRVGHAASAVLVDPIARTILLGRRCQGAGIGEWSFPGGRCESGESYEAAARRELSEEACVEAPLQPPIEVFDRFVSAADGSAAWRVRGHVWPTFQPEVVPRPTPELEPRWVPLDEAIRLHPLAPGILGVLERLRDRFR